MTVDVLVMTDGRGDYLTSTLTSMTVQVLPSLAGQLGRLVIHDDSGDAAYRYWLRSRHPEWTVVCTPKRAGFSGAYCNAWAFAAAELEGEWLFSTEDDFMFNRPVDVPDMADVLEACPWLAQMALRRQPWNDIERAAGGVVESNPLAYTQYDDSNGRRWLEHRLFWTTNPSLHRRALCAVGWPAEPTSEGAWTHRLLARGLPWGVAGDAVRFGYWGARTDGPWVDHIGHVRAGKGY